MNLVCDQIKFVSREGWNASEPTQQMQNLTLPVNHVFIHHTEAPDQCHSQIDCEQKVKGIQKFHTYTRGWGDIGYSFLLGGDERVYVGRGWREIGAHTLGANNISVAISLIGNFDKVDPPKSMLDLTNKWIQCGIEKGVIASDYQLHGHRDQTCTTCPGQHLYDIIKSWAHFKAGKLATYVCRS